MTQRKPSFREERDTEGIRNPQRPTHDIDVTPLWLLFLSFSRDFACPSPRFDLSLANDRCIHYVLNEQFLPLVARFFLVRTSRHFSLKLVVEGKVHYSSGV